MTDGDITWEEMWAEEERQRQAAWGTTPGFEPQPRAAEAAPPTLAPEPYFGGQAPHYPEPQPYFEFSPDQTAAQDEFEQAPALRVTLPSAKSYRRDFDEDAVEGLDEIDWQAPPPVVSAQPSEPVPTESDRDWGSTWADDIHKHRPRHAK
ncbi:MAG: hypothetical protein ACRC20_14540 [Segniliparus sp.]|uniref:hypothetical protein n=1 Tax=Segniliparus sp. TaxID=2804064 RepID=UPI003F35877E